MAPTISIGLPVFNGERYVALALESLLKQDFNDFEVIISDNASTDRTSEICADFARKDRRIRYYRNSGNIGSAPNYNRTFHLSSGQYFKWLAHDDLCRPQFLSRCLEVMHSAPPTVSIVYPQCDLIDASGKTLDRVPIERENRFREPFRRLAHVLRNVGYAYPLWGLLRSSHLCQTRLLTPGAQNDYVLLSELSMQGEFWELPDVLFDLRMHMNNAWAICSSEQGEVAWRDNAKANRRSRQRLLAWTDSKSADKKLWLPFYEDLYWRYLNGVHHARLPALQKLACYLTVPAVCYYRRARNFGSRWKRKFVPRRVQVQ